MNDVKLNGMRELNFNEVEEVSGGWGLPGAFVGGLTGGAGYLGNALTSGSFSWSDLGYSAGSGAVLGAIGGPIGAARAYALPRVSFGLGAAYGAY